MATQLSMRYAGDHYLDRTWALQAGAIEPEGISLSYEVVGLKEHFRRMVQDQPFDAAEMSLSSLISMVSSGDDRLVGLPIFPSRCFRHRQIYVSVDSDIVTPTELVGRRVGVPEYSMTAALWIRAILQHEFGVAPSDVRWRTGSLDAEAWEPRVALDIPGIELERIGPGETLQDLLSAGAIDAIISTHAPQEFLRHDSRIKRLFRDPRAVEAEYYRRTGFFPIMHTVAVRRDVYEANPWVAAALCAAFQASKEFGAARLVGGSTLAIMHPWLDDEIHAVGQLFSGEPFPYGLEANRPTLEAMTRYSYEQGLSPTKVRPESLFAPEVVEWSPN